VFNEPGKHAFHFTLYDGAINQVDLKNRTNHTIHFDAYDIRLDLKQSATDAINRQKDDEEMALGELVEFLKSRKEKDDVYYRASLKFHEKFSIPFACLALGLLAVPLGIQSKTDKRSLGIMLGLVLFLLYYLMLTLGWSFGQTGRYPPLIGMWAPNVLMGGGGLYLLIRSAKDRPVTFNFLRFGLKK
jgi:lipopolysaccharide export system permease protein